jgi:hypothetical protein
MLKQYPKISRNPIHFHLFQFVTLIPLFEALWLVKTSLYEPRISTVIDVRMIIALIEWSVES